MMKVIIISIAVICNILFIVVPIAWRFIYVKKTGKFILGFFLCWGLAFLLSFSMSVIIPGVLLALLPEQKSLIVNSFPEAIINGPVILGGWIWAFIICCIAYRSHKHYIQRLDERKLTDNNKNQIPVNTV